MRIRQASMHRTKLPIRCPITAGQSGRPCHLPHTTHSPNEADAHHRPSLWSRPTWNTGRVRRSSTSIGLSGRLRNAL